MYKFIFEDTLKFLRNFNDKKKIIYISDAEHNYDFELKEQDDDNPIFSLLKL